MEYTKYTLDDIMCSLYRTQVTTKLDIRTSFQIATGTHSHTYKQPYIFTEATDAIFGHEGKKSTHMPKMNHKQNEEWRKGEKK